LLSRRFTSWAKNGQRQDQTAQPPDLQPARITDSHKGSAASAPPSTAMLLEPALHQVDFDFAGIRMD